MSSQFESIHQDESLLFSTDEMAFMQQHEHADIPALMLKGSWTVREKELLQQVASRQKIKHKVPEFYIEPGIFYPPAISLEQSSSSKTAQFKSDHYSGNLFLDLTAGMGIDALFFSKKFRQGILVEKNETMAGITAHNLSLLTGNENIRMVKGANAAAFLAEFKGKADLIYLDPSRRTTAGKKVFHLQDCDPDILSLLPQLLKAGKTILIKTSPLLDISLAVAGLQHVKSVYILAKGNECKELLFELTPGFKGDYQVHAVNIDKGYKVSFFSKEEKDFQAEYALPARFLYEPDVSILKAGAFNLIQQRYAVKKLQQHSHLYTSDELVPAFPGRQFKVRSVLKPSTKDLHSAIPGKKANLTVRNYPATVAQLRKKWDLAEGGEDYLFATTLLNGEKRVILCQTLR